MNIVWLANNLHQTMLLLLLLLLYDVPRLP